MSHIVSAVFHNARDARDAVDWLRDNGVPHSAISVVSRQSADYTGTTGVHDHLEDDEATDEAAEAGKGALVGAGVGAGVGVFFGLAAAAIPGVGPFITAGALASAFGTTGGAAVAGAIVGGTSGGLAGAFSRWGLNEAESRYYAGEVEYGGTYVGVDLNQAGVSQATVTEAFRRFNGRFSS